MFEDWLRETRKKAAERLFKWTVECDRRDSCIVNKNSSQLWIGNEITYTSEAKLGELVELVRDEWREWQRNDQGSKYLVIFQTFWQISLEEK